MRISDWSSDVCSSDLATHHALQPEEFPDAFRHGGAITVVAVEGDGQVLEELGAVVECALADAVKHFHRQTVGVGCRLQHQRRHRSEEHTSELQSLMRISYAVFCLKKKKTKNKHTHL